jgi:glycosyltransferase involved in cell wall biosynthesis
MKILYLITGLRLGGAEKQLLLLANQIQLAGHQVLVVAMESNGVMATEFLRNSINVQELNATDLRSLPFSYRKFKKTVSTFKPDIIHSHMIHANMFAAFFKLFNNKPKLICTAHNIYEGNSRTMASYYFIKRLANWATNVSSEAFDFFIQKKYFDKKKSSFIPNAIDTQVFNPANYNKKSIRKQLNISENNFIFLSAGRLHTQKNYKMLLNAFALVNKEMPDALLYIAGEGPELTSLKTLIIELQLVNNVIFLGRRHDIASLMSASDCFVLSSKFEGFGLVIAEAMAMQIPVISADCGGVKEVMNDLGVLVDVDDINALNNAMLASRSWKRDLQKARRHIEDNYSIPTVLNKWIQLYSGL